MSCCNCCNPCICNPCHCWSPSSPPVNTPLVPYLPCCCPCGPIVPCLPENTTFEVAQQIITCQCLTAKNIPECSEIASGLVIRTDPVGGTCVSVNTTVSVYVSSGPCSGATGASN
jgi:hypothetical protein